MTGQAGEEHVIEPGAWLDGEVSPAERARIQAHLRACPACREAVEEWQALRHLLATYDLPPEAPGAERAFWQELASRLPDRQPCPQPDPAPYLTPLALLATYALLQGAIAVAAMSPMLQGWPALAPAWQQLAASLRSGLAGSSWWGYLLALGASRLAPAIPAIQPGLLRPLALVAINLCLLLALAVPYAAWLLLWLRRPQPLASVVSEEV